MFYHFLFSTCFLVVGCDKELKFSALRKIQISHDDVHDHEDDCDCDGGVSRSHDDADGGSRVNLVRAKKESESFTESNSGTYDVRMYMSKSYVYIWKKLFSSSIPYSACLRGCVCDIIHDFLLTDGLNYERVFDERVKNACRILLSIFLLFLRTKLRALRVHTLYGSSSTPVEFVCWESFLPSVFTPTSINTEKKDESYPCYPCHRTYPYHTTCVSLYV